MAATLTVTITESITLSGKDQGDTTSKTYADIADFSKRTILVPTSEVVLYDTHSSNVAGSTFDSDLLDYVRITNTDDTNYITIRLINKDTDEFVYKISAGGSFLLYSHGATVMNASQAAALTIGSGESAIEYVKAQANNDPCRCEVFLATR